MALFWPLLLRGSILNDIRMFSKKLLASLALSAILIASCTDHNIPTLTLENPAAFKEVSAEDLGGTGASEISAYDPFSKRLFTVNNESAAKIDVLDLSALPKITKLPAINVSALGGVANSVAVYDGKLAIALEALNKQDNGSVVVLNTSTFAQITKIAVGALPDMVTFSPDGKYIVTANEGEPNAAYTNDPAGSISIINVQDNYSVKTLDFSPFEAARTQLTTAGLRVFGPNATLAKDIEPEYVAISADSKKAWVTLQENNGIAEVDLVAGTITKISPLGTKNLNIATNGFDPSDRDNKIGLSNWPVQSFYMPDGLAYFSVGGTNYLITADEGDARDYAGYSEEVRIGSLNLDATAFPNAASLKQVGILGRLRVTNSAGDTDKDGDYDVLYGFGGRGFSIYNAATIQRVFEPGKSLEERVVAAGKYDDDRSDDKGIEAENVTVGMVNGKLLAFIVLERADAVAVYDLSVPTAPQFLQLLPTGDAPEGVLFVPAPQSPNGRSLLIVSCEGDGTVKMYQPNPL